MKYLEYENSFYLCDSKPVNNLSGLKSAQVQTYVKISRCKMVIGCLEERPWTGIVHFKRNNQTVLHNKLKLVRAKHALDDNNDWKIKHDRKRLFHWEEETCFPFVLTNLSAIITDIFLFVRICIFCLDEAAVLNRRNMLLSVTIESESFPTYTESRERAVNLKTDNNNLCHHQYWSYL